MKSRDLLSLIVKRSTIRNYKKKKVPNKYLNKVLEAGIWGPSVINIQPWKFLVIVNKRSIRKIANLIHSKSLSFGVGAKIITATTVKAINNAPLLIIITRTNEFVNFSRKFGNEYFKIADLAELEAVSCAVQNMLLMAEALKLGSSYLDTPLFCESEIRKFLRIDDTLVGIMTLGFPAEKGRRAARKPVAESVRFLK